MEPWWSSSRNKEFYTPRDDEFCSFAEEDAISLSSHRDYVNYIGNIPLLIIVLGDNPSEACQGFHGTVLK